MKCRIEVGNFSGKSQLSVYQDFHAAVFLKNIPAMLVASTRKNVASATASRILAYKSNFIQALNHKRAQRKCCLNYKPIKLTLNCIDKVEEQQFEAFYL
jgi:hypothetical protein